jgi:alpha-mannosidase
VPAAWAGAPVALFLPLGDAGEFAHPEALIYLDGTAYAGGDRYHQEIDLVPEWCTGQTHSLALFGWTGRGVDPDAQLLMRQCALRQIDQPTRELVALMRVALEAVTELDDHHPATGQILNALDAALGLLDLREPWGATFYASVSPALAQLRAGIETAGPPLDVLVSAAGHAHIDIAWLWTLDETRRKAGRTFHTVLRLMEEFPDYHFTQSQPQLYDTVRQDYPALFAAIQRRVQEGRWEILGGMWVEADCNLTGAEALVRQFLLGRSFFRHYFGEEAESPVLWLPDVFGYAWNLPQLIKQAGLEFFFTIKIGWSQYNRMPYDTFWWQGLDGTRVLTHFSPVKFPQAKSGHYSAHATATEVLEGWRHFQQKESSRHLLMSFGHGDGGGGPTREMLENLRELRSFPGLPQVRQEKVIDFYRRMAAETDGPLPVWNGELYLEYHRGTYTTQAGNKRANRRSEFLLHDTEFLASYAGLVAHQQAKAGDDPAYTYPREKLQKAWELVCLNQFHDIIPGSSINRVYIESQQQYAQVREIAGTVQQAALAVLTGEAGGGPLVMNPTSFTRDDLVYWPEGAADQLPAGIQHQQVAGGLLLAVGPVPPYALTALADYRGAETGGLSVSPAHLENDFLRVELNPAGDITRLYDRRHDRELLPPGLLANQWQAFEDRPLDWDAWDIDPFFDDKMWTADPAIRITVLETGPLRATLLIERSILNSHYSQRISLAHHSPRLDFVTTVDWVERHILLKVAFPVDILAPTATYEIQWGHVQRPTHRNTSWDWARFETCAHKWVDLSEGGYGVSLLNDGKYGHDIQDHAPAGGIIRLTLLRSPTDPDPEADQGRHHFTYSLFPHRGRVGPETIVQAYALNDPLQVVTVPGTAGAAASLPSLVRVLADHVVIETVKQAEDGAGIIVRLYEAMQQRGRVTLQTAFPIAAVYRTNLLETNQESVAGERNQVHFLIKPFEIVTLRICPE